MPNIFRKHITKDSRGIIRPSKKPIPVANSRGVPKVGAADPLRVTKLKNKSKPIASLSETKPEDKVRICIQRRLGGIGDILMTTPLAVAFKRRYPGCEFTYSTKPEFFQLFDGNPYVDKLVDYEKINPSDYDLFADVTTTGLSYERPSNPPINRIDLFANYVGIHLHDTKPVYVVSEAESVWSKDILTKWFGPRKSYRLIFLDIASVDIRRTWPVQNSIRLISLLNSLYTDLKFVVNDHLNKYGREWDIKNSINIGAYGIRQKAALMNECDLFVGPDSGMIHFAGALEKNILGIFGSTPAAARINHYKNAISVEKEGLSCLGCFYSHCAINYACMNTLAPETVLKVVVKKLNQASSIPEDLKSYGFHIYNSTPSSYESSRLEELLTSKLSELGIQVKPHSESVPISIDVLKSSDVATSYLSPPKHDLNIGFILVEEEELSREAINRIGGRYDFLLVDSEYGIDVLRRNGVSTLAYKCNIPFSVISNKRPKESITVGSIIPSHQPASLNLFNDIVPSLYDESDTPIRVKLSDETNLTSYTVNEFMSDIDLYIDMRSSGTQLLIQEALSRSIPVISVSRKTLLLPTSGLTLMAPELSESKISFNGTKLSTSLPTQEYVRDTVLDVCSIYDEYGEITARTAGLLLNISRTSLISTLNLIWQRMLYVVKSRS